MLLDDLRHAVRRLRAQPGTAAIAAAMLALAIGVTSAMFTVVDHLLVRPVPFRDPSRLVSPRIGREGQGFLPYVKNDLVRAWRGSPAFEAVSAIVQQSAVIEGSSGPVQMSAVWITPGAFEMLGVSPLRGRTFEMGEGRPGTEDRVIISADVWRSDYAGDPDIIGRRIMLSGAPATVVGVMPPGFRFPFWTTQIWRPYDVDAPPPNAGRRPGMLWAYARLAPGVPPADAARLATAAANGVEPLQDGQRVVLRGLAAGFLDHYSRTAILAFAVGVGLVFLVLCANVTNLILARMNGRRREFGVCSALGASRARLLRQAFLETVLLVVLATAGGLAAAWGLVSLARSFLPEDFLARTLNVVALDWRAVAATSLLGLVAVVAAGLPPAWLGTALDPADSMRAAGRGGTETRAARAWTRGLLMSEVALAVALLVGAGLLVSSFARLMAADPGMDIRGVMTAWISLPDFSFKDEPSRAAFADDLQRQIENLPGVQSVTLSFGIPPDYGANTNDLVQTDVAGAPERQMDVLFYDVEPSFFRVYGIPLLKGRNFGPGDAPGAAIVSEKLAKTLWPGMSPLGHTFTFKGWKESYHVIGVSREVYSSTQLDPLDDLPEFYEPLARRGGRQIMIGLRCGARCPSEAAIRERVRAASPKAIVYRLQPLAAAYREQFARPRAAAGLAFAFALVSLLAAAGGLFSVLSYAVGRRRREFGIRAAMGARPRQLGVIVLRESLGVTAAGLVIGGVVAWLLSRALATLAYGVTGANPLVWGAVGGVIAVSALLAAWRPALGAMRADPLVLLRDE